MSEPGSGTETRCQCCGERRNDSANRAAQLLGYSLNSGLRLPRTDPQPSPSPTGNATLGKIEKNKLESQFRRSDPDFYPVDIKGNFIDDPNLRF